MICSNDRLHFGEVNTEESVAQSFYAWLANNELAERVHGLQCNSPWFEAMIEQGDTPTPRSHEGVVRGRLQLKGDLKPVGLYVTDVRITSDHADIADVIVTRAVARVEGDLTLIPDRIVLNWLRRHNDADEQQMRLFSKSNVPFQITGVRASPREVTLSAAVRGTSEIAHHQNLRLGLVWVGSSAGWRDVDSVMWVPLLACASGFRTF